ncbi:hypothetical protein BCR43DRAFT_495374 [Syncephalastrum racemosum]|uniref:Uncharacterized protein n=1 Tax=Syncephalastrum racemosum TaxID=13706 RepID=A0A1X2H5R4_SYNRA|nr:hypothetical protein BCR43DRAFT_495374 [Syncephalastrum racemosum]
MSMRLSDLVGDLESIAQQNLGAERTPLCENIFDVQYSDLFESYSRLREAFWRPKVPPVRRTPSPEPTTPGVIVPAAAPEQAKKRTRADSETPTPPKRVKRTLKRTTRSKKRMASAVVPCLDTMWGLKQDLLRHLRRDHTQYDHTEFSALLTQCARICSRRQLHHLANYLVPVAEELRRTAASTELRKWMPHP